MLFKSEGLLSLEDVSTLPSAPRTGLVLWLTESSVQALSIWIAFRLVVSVLGVLSLRTPTGRRCLTPVLSGFSSIHFGEQKSKHCLTLHPVQIWEFHCHLVSLLLGYLILLLEVLLGKLGSRFDEGQELRQLLALLFVQFILQLAAFLFLDLFKGL